MALMIRFGPGRARQPPHVDGAIGPVDLATAAASRRRRPRVCRDLLQLDGPPDAAVRHPAVAADGLVGERLALVADAEELAGVGKRGGFQLGESQDPLRQPQFARVAGVNLGVGAQGVAQVRTQVGRPRRRTRTGHMGDEPAE